MANETEDTRPAGRSGPAPGIVELRTQAPGLLLRAHLGREAPTVTEGYGGWERVSRARRTALTQWQGRSSYTLTLPLLLSKFKLGISIEPSIKIIERMAIPPGRATSPPVVRISGKVPHVELPWVISDIAWGQVDGNRKGERTRIEFTLTLWQYIADDLAHVVTPVQKAKDDADKTDHTVKTVVTGDSLSRIAADIYGDASLWHKIADANNIRDPKIRTPRTEIIIP